MTAIGFKFFHSGQAGAPVINGLTGSGIPVLDWILDVHDPVLGWEKVYSGTNAASYRSRYGLQAYLDVNDNGILAGLGRDMSVRAYEAMSALGVGTSPSPLPAVVPVVNWRKSNAASNVARRYCGIKTAQQLSIFIEYDSAPDGSLFGLAQVPALHPAEAYPVHFGFMNQSTNSNITAHSHGITGSQGASSDWGGGSANAMVSPVAWMRNPSGAVKSVSGRTRGSSSALSGNGYSIADGTEIALVRAELMFNDVNTGSGVVKPRSYLPNIWTTAADLVAAGWSPGDTFTVPSYNPDAEFYFAGRCTSNLILEITDTGGAV